MSNSTHLRNTVRKHLQRQIRKGEVQIGRPINLAALSRALNISVTPIREALSQLEQARIVKAIPNRGFVVPKLSLNEAQGLYHSIAELQVLAFEQSHFDSRLIQQLQREQLRLQQTHTPSARLASRVRFHHLLVRNCRNTILLEILGDLESRILFYEQVYINDASFYEHIDNQNEGIIRAIEEDNVPTAALILKMNWMAVFGYVQKQLILEHRTEFEILK